MKKSGFLHFLAQTKLFWGLAVLYGLGILLSPVNRKGVNIFLSAGNQSDVLRQVSINGIIAVGMTLVILTGGIDLSVGSLLSLGTMYAAMLFTLQGWTSASSHGDSLACHCLRRRGHLSGSAGIAELGARQAQGVGNHPALRSDRRDRRRPGARFCRSSLDGEPIGYKIWRCGHPCHGSGCRIGSGRSYWYHHCQGQASTVHRDPGNDGCGDWRLSFDRRSKRGNLSDLQRDKCACRSGYLAR